ncbi:MAG: hypothetical protein M3021_11885, partial [Actinomycetota bacterium]|nr:hypothetical protein [Actinomycetota bacterium]
RDLVRRKFAGKPQAETVLAQYEQQPEVWEAPLRAELIAADVPHDPEIVLAARQVMTLVQPQQAALGKFNNQITGNVQGLVQGDQAQVTMNFGEKPPRI